MSTHRPSPRVVGLHPLLRRAWLGVGLGVVLAPTAVIAQDGCEFGGQGKNDVFRQTVPNVGVITYISGPHFVCEGGVQIWADSAVAYSDRGMSHFLGSVRYLDSERELNADEARYFSDLGRLQAQSNVSLLDESQGSRIENGDLVYLRQTDFRAEETMTVTTGEDGVRPRAVLPPPPDANGTGVPYEVVGDVIVIHGSSSFTSVGDVEIVRDSFFAFADSAEYDSASGSLLLDGAARVDGTTYDLLGHTITIGTPGSETSEVHAFRDARLTGDELLLTSGQIYIFLRDDEIERLVAVPIAGDDDVPPADSADLARPEATVQDLVLTADSLEIMAPNQSVEQVLAAGSARSVSDSRGSLSVASLPDVAQSDWLEGDTIIVTFKPAMADTGGLAHSGDSSTYVALEDGGSGDLEVERVVARVQARSLYRLAPSDTTSRPGVDPPAVHYVTGEEITIEMDDGQVSAMHVVGQTHGVHLEPLARVDTTAARDTIAVIDTTAVVDTTTAIDTTLGAQPPRAAEQALTPGSPAERVPETPDTPEQPAPPDAPREEEPWTPQ